MKHLPVVRVLAVATLMATTSAQAAVLSSFIGVEHGADYVFSGGAGQTFVERSIELPSILSREGATALVSVGAGLFEVADTLFATARLSPSAASGRVAASELNVSSVPSPARTDDAARMGRSAADATQYSPSASMLAGLGMLVLVAYRRIARQ